MSSNPWEIGSVDDLWNHIAYTLLYAPDQFPMEDFLPADEQMNLARAFDLLRQGVEVAYPESEDSERLAMLNSMLDKTLMTYQRGDNIAAGHMLNMFEAAIFKVPDLKPKEAS